MRDVAHHFTPHAHTHHCRPCGYRSEDRSSSRGFGLPFPWAREKWKVGSSGCQAPVGQGHSHVGPDAPARVASALQLRPVPEPASSAGRWLGTPRPLTRPLALEALGDLAASPSEVPGNEGGHSTAPGGPGHRLALPRVAPYHAWILQSSGVGGQRSPTPRRRQRRLTDRNHVVLKSASFPAVQTLQARPVS